MEFNPADPDIIYASSKSYVSNRRMAVFPGSNTYQWSLPTGGFGRVSIAATPANANVIYAF